MTQVGAAWWSAHPNYGLLATVLGVRPAEPGFKRVCIAPHLGPLQRAERRVPHPLGAIVLRLARTEGGGLRGEVILPEGLAGVLEWRGKETALRPGRQDLFFWPGAVGTPLFASLSPAVNTFSLRRIVEGEGHAGR